jgi:D-alanyl-lipoteichoic acid acyltransferase DltB (MBOAT superfamily)
VKEFLAIFAAALAAVSTFPYLVDIVRRKTKPNIVTWLTWTILTLISGLAALAAGEPRAALLLFGSTICTGAVVVLGLKFGIAKFSLFDTLCWIGAGLGLLFWLIFNSPTIGIVVPVIIDFVGMMPTLRHSYLKPDEETWQTFLIGIIAPILTIMSLNDFNINNLAYPLYLLLANTAIVATVVTRRRQLGLPLGRSAHARS